LLTAGREEIRGMFVAALGCNLAWGLVDAVIYWSVRSPIAGGPSRSSARFVLPRMRKAAQVIEGSLSRIAADSSPSRRSRRFAGGSSRCLRCRSVRRLKRDDLLASVAIFLIVVASTFP
jgi:hypothetical protein